MLVTADNYATAMEELSKATRLFVDTETSGLHPWGSTPGGDFHRLWGVHGDRACGISAKARGSPNSFYFPVRHINPADNLPVERVARDFDEILQRILSAGFNYGYDLQILRRDGVRTPSGFEEVSTMGHLLNENEPSFKLKQLAKKYVRPDAADEEEVLKEKLVGQGLGKGNMWRLPAADVAPYACDDVVLTEQLRDFYEPHLRTWKLYDLWQELNVYAEAILAMEMEGLQLDVPLIQQYMEEADREKVIAVDVLRQLSGDAGMTANTTKRQQRWLKLKSVAKEVLEDMIEQPGVAELMMARGWAKVNGTYYLVFLRLMDEIQRLHANLNIIGTDTGRLSGAKPPLHAIPRMREVADRLARCYKVKDVFISEPGWLLGEADYSQAELRVGSHCAQERNMQAVYFREAETGIEADLHGDTARDIAIERFRAKQLNLSCQYGIGKKTYATRYKIPESQAAAYLKKWHQRYPGFRRLYNKAQQVAEARGYIRMFTGRLRHYGAGAATHKASSNLIQGDVAEMIRVAITRIYREMRGYVKMQLTVHDSIVWRSEEKHMREVAPEVSRIMCDQPWCTTPQRVDMKIGDRWGKLQKFKTEKVAA